MNRRNILSTLATGVLALLAPLAAFARRGRDPVVLCRDGRWYRAHLLWNQGVESTCLGWTQEQMRDAAPIPNTAAAYLHYAREVEKDAAALRELLAEAREHFHGCDTRNPDFPVHETLIARIDTALKGHEDAQS